MLIPEFGHDFLDPRTKILMLLLVPMLAMFASNNIEVTFAISFAIIPMLLLIGIKRYRIQSIVILVLYLLSFGLFWTYKDLLTGRLQTIALILNQFLVLIIPSVMAARYLRISTLDSVFISGLVKLKIPNVVIIPLTIIFLYFEVLVSEYIRINKALKQRGVKGMVGRIIPLISSAVQISSDLAAAAMLRGLATNDRTIMDENKIRFQDLLIILFGVFVACIEIFY